MTLGSKQMRGGESAALFRRGDTLYVLDQLLLPGRVKYRALRTPADVADAIRRMVLRGAPLIGCAAAYGYALGAPRSSRPTAALLKRLRRTGALLLSSRPTAVNLAWAVRRMERTAQELARRACAPTHSQMERSTASLPRRRADSGFRGALMAEADAIAREDVEANRRMARHGASLLARGAVVMTICNTGALATAGIGTALGVIREARRTRGLRKVYALETRPYLQGSRLTLWELMQEGIPAALITDGMAAHIMKTERVDAVLAGSDRIAANGDAANKIGTYGLAILARHHRIPFYVVAPSTTVDLDLKNGGLIPIEERAAREVLEIHGKPIAPKGATARHPAFDVTPHGLVTAIVTEKGVVMPATGERLRKVLKA